MGLYDYLRAQAVRFGVNPDYAARVMGIESRGNPNAVSPKGALGPMQLMPATAADLGVDPRDPYQNITGGVRYIAQLSRQFGNDPRIVAAAYNAGPGRTARTLAATGDIPHNRETDAYVARVAPAGAPLAGAPTAGPKTMSRYADPNDFTNGTVVTQAPVSAAGRASGYADPSEFDGAVVVNAGALPKAPQPNAAPAAPATRTLGQQFGRQLGLAARDVLAGGSKLLGIVGDPLNATVNAVAGAHLAPVSGAGDALADSLGLPRPEGTAEKYINNAAQALVGAGGMGAAARGAAAVVPAAARAVAPLAENMGGQAVGAITGSTAAQSADDTVGKNLNPVARFALDTAAGLAGGAAGAGAANRLTNGSTMTAGQRALVDASKRYDFPLRVGDVTGPNTTAANVENAASMIPGGAQAAGKIAAGTNAGIRRALTDTAAKYRPADLPDGAPNVDSYLANDLRSGYSAAKQAASDAFDNVGRVVANTEGSGPVVMNNTRAAAHRLLDNYPDVFKTLTVPKDMQAKLMDIIGSTKPTQVQAGSALEGSANVTVQPKISFDDVRELSKAIGQMQSAAQRQAGITGSEAQLGAVKALYGAVQSDLTNWLGQQPPAVQQAYSAAMNTFKNRVLPYRQDPTIYNVASSRAPADGSADLAAQGLFRNLFNAQQTERAPFVFNLLSEKGKGAAAYQALQDAVAGATSPNSPTGLRVGTGLKGLDLTNPVLAGIADNMLGMPGDIEGMRALLQAARRTNDVLSNPKTGARLLGWETMRDLGGLGAAVGGGGHMVGADDAALLGTLAAGGAAAGSAALNGLSAIVPKSWFFTNPGPAASRYLPAFGGANAVTGGLLDQGDPAADYPQPQPGAFGLIH